MLTLREGEVRPRADRQTKKPIANSKTEMGRGEWAGSDLPAEQATGRVAVGRRVGGGREGGLLQPSTLSSRLTILPSASVEEGDACSVRL